MHLVQCNNLQTGTKRLESYNPKRPNASNYSFDSNHMRTIGLSFEYLEIASMIIATPPYE